MSNIGEYQKAQAGSTASPYGGGPTVAQAYDFHERFDKLAADGMASTATADTLLWTNPYDFTVYMVSARLTCTGAGITADNTNFATIALKSNDGVGGVTATGLSITTAITDSGNITANQPKAFTLVTASGAAVPAGGSIWLNISKAAAGVVVPVSQISVRLRRGEFTGN